MPLLAARVFVLLHVKDVSEQSKQAWLVCPSSKCLEFAAFPSSLSTYKPIRNPIQSSNIQNPLCPFLYTLESRLV